MAPCFLLATLLALCSLAKVQCRACNAQEAQTLHDCMVGDFRTTDTFMQRCFQANNCPSDYFQHKYAGQPNVADNEAINPDYEAPSVDNQDFGNLSSVFAQFSIFNQSAMGKCLDGMRMYTEVLLGQCAENDVNLKAAGFKMPITANDGSSDQPRFNGSANYTACNENGLSACIAGRQHGETMCQVMRKCGKDQVPNCDLALTTDALCTCSQSIFSTNFDLLKNNLTKCLNPPANWTLTISATDRQMLIAYMQKTSPFCSKCFQAPKTCAINDVMSMSMCVQRSRGDIDQCYRASGCPRPIVDSRPFGPDANITNPFPGVDSVKMMTCGMAIQLDVTTKIGTCVKTAIPTLDLSSVFNDNITVNAKEEFGSVDIQTLDKAYANITQTFDKAYANFSSVLNSYPTLTQQKPICNTAVRDACLDGRKWNAPMCDIDHDCSERSQCDLEKAKNVACGCAQQTINVNTFPAYFTKFTTCLGVTVTLNEQQKGAIMDSITHHFCECTGGNNGTSSPRPPPPPPTGERPAGPPPAKGPRHPEIPPPRPQQLGTPSPQAAKFVSLLHGRRRK